jgi:hypothetical protein
MPVTPPLPDDEEPSPDVRQDTPTTGPLQIPIGGVALPVAEEDEEIIEIAWGGRSSNGVPVVLDDVPDVSEKMAVPTLATDTPSSDEGRSGSTLVTQVPPPPEQRPPTAPPMWARGTVTKSQRIFMDHDTEEDLLLEEPPGREAPPGMGSRPRIIDGVPESGPVVIFRKSDPLPEPAPSPTRPRRRARAETEIGSSIVARASKRRIVRLPMRKLAVVVALVAAAGVLAWLLVRGLGTDTASRAPLASLAFSLEPADAVVEIEGHDTVSGTPARIDLEPGEYRVTVRREGYRSWVSSIRVEKSENQTVRVALERGASGAATVVVRAPPGMAVTLDGNEVESKASGAFDVAPGAHTIELKERNGRSIWRHAFTAAANTRYEFHPGLQGAERDRRDASRRRRKRKTQAPTIEGEIEQRPPESSAPLLPAGDTSLAPLPPAAAEPPEAPPPSPEKLRQKRSRPVVVPPSKVQRVLGKPPVIPRHRRNTAPARVSAKLCIDTRGNVTSAAVLTKVSGEVARAVEKALAKWRYLPVRDDGEPVPACFAINFALR